MIDDRIARRRAEVRDEGRRRRLRRTLLVVGALALVGVLVLVERSSLVGLEEVVVVGAVRLDAAEVREVAGLELGTSTLRLPLAEAQAAVTELPLVRTATARRLDPLTVEIMVVEREPVLVAVGAGERRRVDRDGVIVLVGGQDGLPEVRLTGRPPVVGRAADADPALGNAHAVWRGLSGPLRSQVVAYHATSGVELELELDRGTRVRFGRAERLDEKVRALGAVLEDVGTTPVAWIDVRAPEAPVVVGE